MAQITVTITPGTGTPPTTPPTVSNNLPTLSVSNGDFILWQCDPTVPSFNFNVLMDHGTHGSPFRHAKFDQVNNNSGVPLVTPISPKTQVHFKYLVEVGRYVLDPGVIITP